MSSSPADLVVAKLNGQLQKALERWYAGDPFAYAELCASDVSYFDPWVLGRVEGLDALKRHFERYDGKVFRPRFEMLDCRSVAIGDGTLFMYCLQSWQADNTPDRPWNATELYRDLDGRWRIVHAHWSLPANQ